MNLLFKQKWKVTHEHAVLPLRGQGSPCRADMGRGAAHCTGTSRDPTSQWPCRTLWSFCSHFEIQPYSFPQRLHRSTFSATLEGSNFSSPLPSLGIFSPFLLMTACLVGVQWRTFKFSLTWQPQLRLSDG